MLAGYASRTNLSRGIHDPLSARAMAFEKDGKRLVLISLDILGFYNGTAEPLRRAILNECRLQPSDLFLCAIHTHSAPTPTLDAAKGHANNVEYTRTLQSKLVKIAREAMDRMASVQLGVGSGASPVGVNRREVVRDNAGNPRIVLGRNPHLPIDREVQVLKLASADRNELIGALFAYATHSTLLGPRNFLVSGDVHGLAAQFIEKHLGAGVIAPPFAGASGNIDPWYRVLPEFNTTNSWVPEPVLLGTLLGEEVVHVLKGIQNSVTNAEIRTSIKTVSLPGKARGEAQSSSTGLTTPLVLTAACVGDVAFVGLGGEIFTEIGQAIKAASPFPRTIILTHCNGAAGYLPIRSAYPEGGYEVQSSPFAPGADEQVIEEAKRMLAELRRRD